MSRPDVEARALEYLKSHLGAMTEIAEKRLKESYSRTVTLPWMLDGEIYELSYDGTMWRFKYHETVDLMEVAP